MRPCIAQKIIGSTHVHGNYLTGLGLGIDNIKDSVKEFYVGISRQMNAWLGWVTCWNVSSGLEYSINCG